MTIIGLRFESQFGFGSTNTPLETAMDRLGTRFRVTNGVRHHKFSGPGTLQEADTTAP